MNSQMGFDFEGRPFAPGTAIPVAQLHPPGFPDRPVVLECAGANGGRGHVRGECLYILWRYEMQAGWVELGRATSVAWEWSVDLGPLAHRVMNESRRSAAIAPKTSDLAAVIQSICAVIDQELKQLPDRDRLRVAAILQEQVASRVASCRLSNQLDFEDKTAQIGFEFGAAKILL